MKDNKNLPVRDFMTRNPIYVPDIAVLETVRVIFSKKNIHHLPVINSHNKLVGIISRADLNTVTAWAGKFNVPSAEMTTQRLLNSLTALDLCTKEVYTVRPNDTINTCYEMFKMNSFKALPVITEDGSVVGIITTYDLLTLAYEEREFNLCFVL